MFDSSLSEQDSFLNNSSLDPTQLNPIGTSELDLITGTTPQNELSLGSEFDISHFDQLVTAWDSINDLENVNNSTEALSLLADSDLVTGTAPDSPIVGQGIQEDFSSQTASAFSSSLASANSPRTLIVRGTLFGDRFTLRSGYSRTVFSGNGNVNLGNGVKDVINLSNLFLQHYL